MEKQISHFKILEEIGSGGMGVVYRARDQRLRRKVALKVLPAGALAEPMIRERLMREAQTASSLNHPHIVTVFEIHSAGDRDFIAMEFVEGRSLDRVIGEEGLALERALRYAVQIADALSCAHEHGVIHRDLKPQNVMITPNDDVKILDFGLAKRFVPAGFDGKSENSSINPGLVTLTAPGVKVGTPAYMSPEQIESHPIDARSDVFSFGCLLYEMLTGVTPFYRRNAILIFKAVLTDQPEPLRTLRPKLPAILEKMLARAMKKKPDDRYDSMRELLGELEKLQGDLFGSGMYPTRPGTILAALPPGSFGGWRERIRRHPLWRPVALAVMLLLITLAVVWLARRVPSAPRLTDHRLVSAFRGSHRQASFSPSGDRIAFVSDDAAGQPQLWTQLLTGGLPDQVTAVDFAPERPHYVPGANRLLFGGRGGGVWSLRLTPDGVPARRLEIGSCPRLSPDGTRLLIEHEGRLWLGESDGSQLAPLASVPASFFAQWTARSPAFSPDGQRVAYFHPEVGPTGSLWVAPLDEGEPWRVVERSFRAGSPVWTPNGEWIIFSGDLGGGAKLWTVPARGGEPQRLTHEAGRHTEPALSHDGRQIIYTTSYPSYALKLRSAATGEERQVLESHHDIVRPTLSPTGDRVAFFSPEGSGVHLFTVGLGGDDLRQVTKGTGERNILPQWSADGAFLYFYQEEPTRSFRRVASEGGASTQVLADWSWDTQYDAVVDPVGQRVAYTPLKAGVPGSLRLRDLKSGEEQDLGEVLQSPRWSRGGEQILGAGVADRIYLCPLPQGPCRYLTEGFRPLWGIGDRTIYFARRTEPFKRGRSMTVTIWSLELADLTETRIAEVEAYGPLAFGFDLSPNGDLVWNQMLPSRQELWLADLE